MIGVAAGGGGRSGDATYIPYHGTDGVEVIASLGCLLCEASGWDLSDILIGLLVFGMVRFDI